MKFYDTCSLITLQKEAFAEDFLMCNLTFKELEHIKSSGTKDEETKWQARQALHLFDFYDNYEVLRAKVADDLLKELDLEDNNDSRIITTAYRYYNSLSDEEKKDFKFITSDTSCRYNAESVGLPTEYTNAETLDDSYTGYLDIYLSDDELVLFYSDVIQNKKNVFNLIHNQYLLIKDCDDKIIDKYRWDDEEGYVKLTYVSVNSQMFGKISPKDDYQQIALDSLAHNQISMLRGPAGSGKSLLSFAHMFHLLEKGKISKIIVFCNTVATKGSAKLGYYPGTRTEKLLDSQIGNLLESKLGDRIAVEGLIEDGALVLLPLSDIRGYDTSGMNAAVYISEAQNLDVEMIRLALQRIGEDSICILDGDFSHQVDLSSYAGVNNGMRRVSHVFRGSDIYGEVQLQRIYRSKIADLAEKL